MSDEICKWPLRDQVEDRELIGATGYHAAHWAMLSPDAGSLEIDPEGARRAVPTENGA
jgi:hypothetical protein